MDFIFINENTAIGRDWLRRSCEGGLKTLSEDRRRFGTSTFFVFHFGSEQVRQSFIGAA
jgi:hypothetical protein